MGQRSATILPEISQPLLTPKQEVWVVALIAAIQFINILDFMMVMPLGPDFSESLGIPLSQLGLISGSYTAAACFSGVLGSLFLDRFDRRPALLWAVLGLALATAAGGLAHNLTALLLARVAAGFFAGPATSLAYSVIADVIPTQRRGRAMGTVMLSFSLASILGVPAGLEIARLGGWHAPFFAVGAIGLSIAIATWFILPSIKHHLEKSKEAVSLRREFWHVKYLLAYLAIGASIFGTFLLVPNLSGYLQINLKWPREKLGMLYLLGGLLTLFSTRWGGAWIDRRGVKGPILFSTSVVSVSLVAGFLFNQAFLPIPLIFALLMSGNSLRFVVMNTLVTRVPPAHLRARFLSSLNAFQHMLTAAAAMGSTLLLDTDSTGELVGIPLVAGGFLAMSWVIPPMVLKLERSAHH